MLNEPARLEKLSARLKEMAVLDSAERIYSVIISLSNQKKKKARKNVN